MLSTASILAILGAILWVAGTCAVYPLEYKKNVQHEIEWRSSVTYARSEPNMFEMRATALFVAVFWPLAYPSKIIYQKVSERESRITNEIANTIKENRKKSGLKDDDDDRDVYY